MAEFVYVIVMFLTPFSEAQFDVAMPEQIYPTQAACFAAIPEVLGALPESAREDVRGVGCVTPWMADAILNARDVLTP